MEEDENEAKDEEGSAHAGVSFGYIEMRYV
jgi:hypothetical protein